MSGIKNKSETKTLIFFNTLNPMILNTCLSPIKSGEAKFIIALYAALSLSAHGQKKDASKTPRL